MRVYIYKQLVEKETMHLKAKKGTGIWEGMEEGKGRGKYIIKL